MPDYKLIEVKGRRLLKRFVIFPDELYADCPQYVPALHSDQIRTLTKSASLEYCRHKLWLVMKGNEVAGRICAIINPRYNERYGTRRVRFGWFDCINDLKVASMLIDAASLWAKDQGMTEIHGPLHYNTFGKQGMLVEGYEKLSPFNCLYNYPYYNDLLQQLGFEKECDWVQYKMPAGQGVPPKAHRVAALVSERYGLKEADLDSLKKDKEMVRKFFRLYNESFADNVYNYIPLTEAEMEQEAESIMPFISGKSSCILLDNEGEIAAFGISTPSLSMAFRKARGRLLPFGWWHILKASRDYELTDLMANGASPKWQNKGVSALYYEIMAAKAAAIGNKWAVTNPQIESNSAVNIWNSYEREPYMRRRCYIRKID